MGGEKKERSEKGQQQERPRGTPLRAIPEFPPDQARQLASLWITTAEEFVSLAATPAGRAGLADALDITQEDLAPLIQIASDGLPEEDAEELARPSKRKFSMGAILPELDDEGPERDEEP